MAPNSNSAINSALAFSLPPFELIPRVGGTSFNNYMRAMAENKTADIFPERFVTSHSRYQVKIRISPLGKALWGKKGEEPV